MPIERRIELANQHPLELQRFIEFIKENHVRRYCEIGARNGETFYRIMNAIGPEGFGFTVDLGVKRNCKSCLIDAHEQLIASGIRGVGFAFGNSQDWLVVRKVAQLAPFDLILIDADHRYVYVKRDFDKYKNLGKIIAFHDVSAPEKHMSDGFYNGVGRFWQEIKNHNPNTYEIVEEGSNMGFGILVQ